MALCIFIRPQPLYVIAAYDSNGGHDSISFNWETVVMIGAMTTGAFKVFLGDTDRHSNGRMWLRPSENNRCLGLPVPPGSLSSDSRGRPDLGEIETHLPPPPPADSSSLNGSSGQPIRWFVAWNLLLNWMHGRCRHITNTHKNFLNLKLDTNLTLSCHGRPVSCARQDRWEVYLRTCALCDFTWMLFVTHCKCTYSACKWFDSHSRDEYKCCACLYCLL